MFKGASCFVPQLRAALYDIHDIFFEMPLGDRLALLQQERELRAERKLRDMVNRKYHKFCPAPENGNGVLFPVRFVSLFVCMLATL